MNSQRIQIVNFFVLLILAAALALIVIWPFAKLIVFAVILAVLFWPVYKWLERKTKSPGLAAFISIICIALIVLVPLLLLGKSLINELTGIYRQAQSQQLFNLHSDFWQSLPPQIQNFLSGATSDTSALITRITGNLFQSASYVVSHLIGFFLSMVLLLISTYYLLKDGKRIKSTLEDILPLSERQENLLSKKIDQAISGVVRGTFLMAIIRGIIVYLGFLVFGVPNPLLWSLLFAIVSMIPPIGTGLGIAVAVIYLLLAGHIGSAIGMAILGAGIVVLLDTLFAPKFMSMQTQIHPLLVMFGILGGVGAFGFVGLFLGPILMVLFAALLEIYRSDLKAYLEK